VLGAAGVSIGMLFCRSLADGISHSPQEQTAVADIEVAIDVLVRALPALCTALPRATSVT
jgi:acetylornithine deacetylase/succinyl-diaminopimelate desuccinylase-like protein